MNEKELNLFAAQIRRAVLYGLRTSHAGHVGGEMDLAELMAVLYGNEMKIDPSNPQWDGRDYMVMSKGHCGPVLIATLALKGYFPYEDLKTMNQNGTRYPNHCDRNKTPGIDMTTGSLGQGFSLAMGMAFALKYQHKNNRVYVVLGDGECDEGQVYEAALFAHTKKLNNIIAFIDRNQKQLDGYTKDICDVGDLRKKFEAFEWYSQECDGHDVNAISACIHNAQKSNVPAMIVLDTIKGKDCTFAEHELYNHHMKFTDEMYQQADAYLADKIKELENDIHA